MTATILVALGALISAVFAGALLAPTAQSSSQAPRQALAWAQWPGRPAPRATLFTSSPYAITGSGR